MINPLIGVPPWLLIFSGTALGWLKSFWHSLYDKTIGRLVQRISVSLLIEEADFEEMYRSVSLWAERYLSKKNITDLSLRRMVNEDYDYPGKSTSCNFEVIPAYGSYYFRWKKKYLVIFTSKKDSSANSGGDGVRSALKAKRSVSIKIYGTTKRDVLFEAIQEAKDIFDANNPKHLKYYTNSGDFWCSNFLPRRSMDTVYIPKTVKQEIIQTAEDFFSSEDRYRNLGIPWRTGFLFYGAPGTGKTSVIQALSNELSVPIYYFNLGAILRLDDLVELMRSAEKRSIMLFEDIDSVDAAKDRDSKKDFSLKANDLLNCIDGIIATEGRIVIMTTNHIEKLDPALIRSGRIDKRFHLDYAQEPELHSFYDNAKKYVDLPEYQEFRNMLPEPCTIADAQTILFKKDV